jgi:hypothetical protein
MSRTCFKIDQVVRPEHRRELEAMAVDATVSIDRMKDWLCLHGYKISRTAVERWRTDFRAVASDPVRQLRRYLAMRIDRMPSRHLKSVCELVNRLPV